MCLTNTVAMPGSKAHTTEKSLVKFVMAGTQPARFYSAFLRQHFPALRLLPKSERNPVESTLVPTRGVSGSRRELRRNISGRIGQVD